MTFRAKSFEHCLIWTFYALRYLCNIKSQTPTFILNTGSLGFELISVFKPILSRSKTGPGRLLSACGRLLTCVRHLPEEATTAFYNIDWPLPRQRLTAQCESGGWRDGARDSGRCWRQKWLHVVSVNKSAALPASCHFLQRSASFLPSGPRINAGQGLTFETNSDTKPLNRTLPWCLCL